VNKPAVIFFDLGNTLVTGMDQTPRRALADRLGLSEKETKKAGRLLMVHPAREPAALALALRTVLPDKDPAQIGSAIHALWAEHFSSIRAVEGATPLLLAIKQKGIRLGVISNCWEPAFSGFCRACPEMADLLDHTILSYRVECKKPQKAIFQLALGISRKTASECWMVGDTFEQDIYPAKLLGFHTVWVLSRPGRERSALARILRGEIQGPDSAVEGIGQILPLIEGI
jgi:HAD superfamily hydrolase (TIGR01549 family)